MNNTRALLIILFMFAFFMVLVLKLFSIQITDHKMYTEMAKRQQNKTIKVKGERGKITDRNGEVLAYTLNNVSLFVDTRMAKMKEREKIANKFSEVFGKDKKYYMKLMNSGYKNVCLERKVSKEKQMMFNDFRASSFFIQEDFTRVYPYGSLLSHSIGYVDNECNGINGTEKEQEEFLQGKDGIRHIENDSIGRTVSVKDNVSVDAVPGKNIQLTIDKSYQKILEDELKSGKEKYGGESAVGIIMDPNSGEILALSNLPDYDPANYNLFDNRHRRNRCITDTYEPGSTIKPIIMSILIDNNLADPSEIINTENGEYYIGNTKITDTHRHDYLSVRGILEESSNIGMAKLSSRISSDTFYKYLRSFGFGVKTGIDLPGETDGFLKKPNSYTSVSKEFISFGYEISTTPLQLITALSAVVNGGTLYKPYITKRILDNQGNVIRESAPAKIRSTISSRTSDILKDFMVGIVESGTGKNARLNNVVIGGKTGTAQIYKDGSYSRDHYHSSFAGFLPIDKPQLICFIQISSPKIGKYGSMVAAPIFKSVMERIVEADLDLIPREQTINRDEMFVEKILNEIESDSKKSYFTASNIAETGDPVIDTNTRQAPSKMPDLTGLALRTAMATLTNFGIEYEVVGSGRIESQSILPGSSLSSGDVVLLKCKTKNSVKELILN